MIEKNDLPVSSRQLLYLALLICLPLALTATVLVWAPAKPGQTESDALLAVGIVGTIAVVLLALLVVAAQRHEIEISRDALVVRHSLYTLTVQRSEVKSVNVREVTSLDQLGLSSRKNGIAAFGYFSGWFRGKRGDLAFCALSGWPACLVTFEGSTTCRQLALSASPEVVRGIEAWGKS